MLGVDEREQELIHTAALLHDIGKFIFPDSILFAERKLTDEEWEIVKLHPEQGAKLVRRIEGYGPVADIIYCHHERYDGNGYYKVPLEQIPLGSRIIAAADTYDVMTSRDSYRRPVSSEAALAELAPGRRQPARPDGRRRFVDDPRDAPGRVPARRSPRTSSASSASSAASRTTPARASRPRRRVFDQDPGELGRYCRLTRTSASQALVSKVNLPRIAARELAFQTHVRPLPLLRLRAAATAPG